MTPEDLLSKASDLAEARYVAGKHQMFSVLLTKSGKVFEGTHVEAGNGRISLCAEAVAIGAAATAGDTEIALIVAVTESKDVVPPCGMCRELISDYSTDARVVMMSANKITLIPIAELLPRKYNAADYPNKRFKK